MASTATAATATLNPIDVKFEYLIQQMEWCVATSRYDYMCAEIGLPLNYEFQFQDAAKWYQLSRMYYKKHTIELEKPYYLFLEKWYTQHPMDATQSEALTKELRLSDFAMQVLYGKSPRYPHLDEMDVLLLTEVEMPSELIPTPEEVANQQHNEHVAKNMEYNTDILQLQRTINKLEKLEE